jgi:hypothetical protein
MKQRRIIFSILLIILPLLLGMSGLGTEAPGKIPLPEKNFTASFVDHMDIITEAGRVSIDGGVFLEGKRGEGTFAVAFENIRHVDFLYEHELLQARLLLKDGSSQMLVMNKKARAYGKTKYGTFQIRLVDLKRMTITGQLK